MRVLSIDPGTKKGVAYALFSDAQLLSAGIVKLSGDTLEPIVVDRMIIEMPKIYASKGVDKQDLVHLAFYAGLFAGRHFSQTKKLEVVFPQTWCGSIPKKIRQERIWEKMNEKERKLLEGVGKLNRSDIMDAIGIGLHVCDMDRALVPGGSTSIVFDKGWRSWK